jgi:hypothetical protein
MAKCSSSRRLVPLPLWADFIERLLKKNEKKLNRSFNLTFRYIEDVLSLNNFMFGEFVDRIYPIELEIKDNTYTDRSASYLDLHLEIDSERLVYCLWCWVPLSTLFQLYRGGQVYWCGGGNRPKPPTWRKSLTNFAMNGVGTLNLSGDRHSVHM